MFNLLVRADGWAENRSRMPIERMLKHTEPRLIGLYKSGNKFNFDQLLSLPTLFVAEISGSQNQIAHVGKINHADINGKDIVIDFTHDASIPLFSNRQLQGFASDLCIDRDQFLQTHWAVKDTDLYKALLRNLPGKRLQPKVFRLNEVENIDSKFVSVMMPFQDNFKKVYSAIKAAAETVGCKCARADDIWENPSIIQDVVSLIDKAAVVICDCTGKNPNVFYEIGIAHSLGREVILITQKAEDIPFDVCHLRHLRYLNNGEGLKKLRIELEKNIKAAIQGKN